MTVFVLLNTVIAFCYVQLKERCSNLEKVLGCQSLGSHSFVFPMIADRKGCNTFQTFVSLLQFVILACCIVWSPITNNT